MAKGKHHRSAENRRSAAARNEIEGLCAELLAEHSLATEAEVSAAVTEAASMALHEAESARDRAVKGEVTRLAVVLEELSKAVEAEEKLADGISTAWERVRPTLASMFGGGIEAWEALTDAFAGRHVPGYLTYGVTRPEHMSPRAIHALQRARGQRHEAFDEKRAERAHPAKEDSFFILPSVEATLGVASSDEVRRIVARAHEVARSRANVGDSDVAYAWSMVSSLIPLPDSAATPFGSVEDETRDEWDRAASRPDTGARTLAEGTRASSTKLLDGKRWANPLQPPPLFPRPGDAAVLRWWYRQAALASQVLVDEYSARPGTPEAERDVSLMADCVEMLDGAALYWLPPGQAVSYLQSQPLAPDDREDLRLPYGRTFVVPAEPIHLHPSDIPPMPPEEEDPEARTKEEILMEAARAATRASKIATSRIQTPGDAYGAANALYLGDALRLRGALIEGVLLEADRAGRRTDRVIWCLALPTGDGTAVFGRVAIAALASRSGWHDVLDQLSAVAAWGDWVELEPDADDPANDSADGGKAKKNVDARAPGSIRVLDVGRTESETHSATPSGRKIAPHTRRGHWRRQHTGPGGEVIKRVRIPPTVVNASLGPLAPRVYRLPAPSGPPVEAASAEGLPAD